MTLPDIRRIVTGHDDAGRAIVLSNGPLPHVTRPALQPGLAFHEVWNTNETPVPVAPTEAEPTDRHRDTAPPKGGTIIRLCDIPPEGKDGPDFDAAQTEELFGAVGLAENAKHTLPGRHPLMHRTESIDYGIVIFGEITLMLDDEEVALRAGDVVVQRGTIHAWANRSDEVCRMAFVLVDGRFDPEMAKAQSDHDAALRAAAEAT